ncbi:MAG: proton-conducting membrane transporter [Deltaproteobacteria bacterium]|nr:proton-conducting membrane transporter [Deltaproteobacteria bacterium]
MILVLIAALALLSGVVLAIALRNNVHRGWASIASQGVASACVLAQAIPMLVRGGEARSVYAWSYPVETVAFQMDALSAFFLAWSLPLTLLGTIYAFGYLRPNFKTRNAGVQFALLNVVSLSFIMIYTFESAMPFLLGWEIAALAAWLLVIWEYRNQKIRFAGFNYLVSTHVGMFFLVAAFMVMYSQTGSMDFLSFATLLHTPSSLRDVTFVLLITSFGLKSAFFPFHTWLPRAHSAAPAHVSALMSGVIHKAGLYGLLRFTLLMGDPEPWMGWYLIGFSTLSAVAGVLYTSAQRDLKRLLGYSSTENVGIAGIGFGVGYLGLCWHQPALIALGFGGGILHLLNHALFKCLLFYAAGAVYTSTHTIDLERLGGLSRKMPWTGGFFLLGGLAISALPPLNGFVSEFLIYSGLFSQAAPAGMERGLLVVVGALLAFVGGVSALSMVRAHGITFLGAPRDPAIHSSGEVKAPMLLPMAVHAVGMVALGLLPVVGLSIVNQPATLFLELQPQAHAVAFMKVADGLWPITQIGVLVVALVLVLAVLRRWLVGRPQPASVGTWGCGYPAVSPRMQYTGTSFSRHFASIFETFLPHRERKKLPETCFPAGTGHLNTHCADAVERRMFEILGNGDKTVARMAKRIPEEPRFSFGIGLVVLVTMIGLLLFGTGSLR